MLANLERALEHFYPTVQAAVDTADREHRQPIRRVARGASCLSGGQT